MFRYYIDFSASSNFSIHQIPLVKNKFSRKSTFYISDKTKEKWPQIKCSDGIKGQDETGVDCGGPCKPCGNINNILNE